MVALVSPTKQKLGTAELLFQTASHMDLKPDWVTPNGLFAVQIDTQEHYINFARSPFNSDIGVSLARNKYLTRQVLQRHELQNIPFALPRSHGEAVAFLRKYKKIIAKPLSGSGSYDIHIVTAAHQLESINISACILEQYIAGEEFRYLILNREVIAVHRSDYGTSVQADRTLQRISFHPAEWNRSLVASALKIGQILGLEFAAVDYIIDATGCAYILEVNTMPGLKWFHAPSSGPPVDVARQFLQLFVEKTENKLSEEN